MARYFNIYKSGQSKNKKFNSSWNTHSIKKRLCAFLRIMISYLCVKFQSLTSLHCRDILVTDRQTDKRTDERTNRKSPHSTGLRPLSGLLPKKEKKKKQKKKKKKKKKKLSFPSSSPSSSPSLSFSDFLTTQRKLVDIFLIFSISNLLALSRV